MNTVFIGGSRRTSRLPDQAKQRLGNIVRNDHRILVGDASGVDKAVQQYLLGVGYRGVTVFCSGDTPRNNLGGWPVEPILPPGRAKGFQFHAAKDRAMALQADFGLMIWDGSSPGTILNVLRLVRAGKSSVLINVSDSSTLTLKSATQWDEFLSRCSPQLRADLEERSTAEEWKPFRSEPQPVLLDGKAPDVLPEENLADVINRALANGNMTRLFDALGSLALARGMTQVARQTELARDSLTHPPGTSDVPDFATVLRLMTAIGLRIEVSNAAPGPA